MNHLSQLNESSLCLTGAQHTYDQAQNQKRADQLHQLSNSLGHSYLVSSSNQSIRIDSAFGRRSRNDFSLCLQRDQVMELLDLSLFKTDTKGLRPYPAAGAIYSVQVYLVNYHVDALTQGVYSVRWNERTVDQIGSESRAQEFLDDGVFQKNKEQIPLIALLVLDTRLSSIKYHDRAHRFALLEAGALMQTIYLAAETLGLSALALGGIADRAALRVCGLDWHEQIGFACGIALGKADIAGTE